MKHINSNELSTKEYKKYLIKGSIKAFLTGYGANRWLAEEKILSENLTTEDKKKLLIAKQNQEEALERLKIARIESEKILEEARVELFLAQRGLF